MTNEVPVRMKSTSPMADGANIDVKGPSEPRVERVAGKFVSKKAPSQTMAPPRETFGSTDLPPDLARAAAEQQAFEAANPAPDDEELGRDVDNELLTDGQRRIPLGQRTAKMAYPARPGFVRRWINDQNDRPLRAIRGGWKHVLSPATGNPEVINGGTAERGGGLSVYLMEIPAQFYQEDDKRKQESLDMVDKTIYRGTFNQEPGDSRYVPTSTPINFRTERGAGRG